MQAAAQVAIQRGLALAVLPGGALNHFARDAGVIGVADTAKAVLEGHAAVLDTAEVTIDRGTKTLFLNTASIGGYPDTVRLREKLEHKLGKWPAAAPLEVRIDGKTTAVWMIFVGNGRYAPSDQVPMSRPTISEEPSTSATSALIPAHRGHDCCGPRPPGRWVAARRTCNARSPSWWYRCSASPPRSPPTAGGGARAAVRVPQQAPVPHSVRTRWGSSIVSTMCDGVACGHFSRTRVLLGSSGGAPAASRRESACEQSQRRVEQT